MEPSVADGLLRLAAAVEVRLTSAVIRRSPRPSVAMGLGPAIRVLAAYNQRAYHLDMRPDFARPFSRFAPQSLAWAAGHTPKDDAEEAEGKAVSPPLARAVVLMTRGGTG